MRVESMDAVDINTDMTDQNEFNARVIAEFRANEGRVGPPFEGRPMILVTHRGAKSGNSYTTPLVYGFDNDRYVLIASMGGAPVDPQWYRNMVANPEVVVEVGTEQFDATVAEVTGDERDRLYAAMADAHPVFADYAAKAGRVIPVLTLTRVES
jgi:deazaflavin-dependent oxidoreductase (nitroreductase family)